MNKSITQKLKDITPKIILVFLYLQPFLDVVAGILLNTGHANYISNTIRLIFMLYIIIYLLFTKYEHKKSVLIYLFLLAIYLSISSIVIINFKGKYLLFTEIKSTINSFYFIILLIGFLVNYKENAFDKKHLRNLLIIYTLLTFIPNILKIGFNSYNFERVGSSGWFYSANSLGSILLFLLVSAIDEIKKLPKWLMIIIALIYLYTIFSLGTKTPIIGLLLLIIVNLVKYLVNSYKNKKKFFGICFIILVFGFLGIFILPKTKFYKNLEIYQKFLDEENIKFGSFEYIDHIVFGMRLECARNERISYKESDLALKLFGIGYTYEPTKLAEMDYLDILYREGIIGFIIYFSPFVYAVYLFTKNNKNCTNKTNNYLNLFLILVLSLVQGHILTTPSVSIYVSLILVLNRSASLDKKPYTM